MIGAAIGVAVIALLSAWLFGGILLRAVGALLILAGAVALAGSGGANAALVLLLGVALRWSGHLHYALRHGAWKSPLAARPWLALAVWWGRFWSESRGEPVPSRG